MARLNALDVDRLVAALHDASQGITAGTSGREDTLQHGGVGGAAAVRAHRRMHELAAGGSLGPALTQRLAAYIGKPVRCTCEDTQLAAPSVGVAVRTEGLRIWLRMERALASAIADAMIGGDGDPAALGFNAAIARLTKPAALVFLRSITDALSLAEPSDLEEGEDHRETDQRDAAIGGHLWIGTQHYGWQAGVDHVPEAAAQAVGAAAESLRTAATTAVVDREVSGIEGGLENARRQLAGLLGSAVSFTTQTVSEKPRDHMPEGWLRLGLASHEGGVVVLAVDRRAAIAIAHLAARARALPGAVAGDITETGAEVVLRETLCALAAALGGAREEPHHVVRLGDDAIVAGLPHLGIEHDVACNRQSWKMRWLVPAHLIRPHADQPGAPRGAR